MTTRDPGRCFRQSSGLGQSNYIILAVFLCLATTASAQSPQLMISCVPLTGPTQVSVPYSATCTASGGAAPYSWSIVSGTLPDGLTLSSNTGTSVTISGTPTTMGAYSYTVQLADSSPPPTVALQPYSGT